MKYWLTGIALILLAFGGWYWLQKNPTPSDEIQVMAPPPPLVQKSEPVKEKVPGTPSEETVAEAVIEPPPAPPVEATPLPELSESDPLAVQSLAELVGEASVVRYFAGEEVISRLVSTVDALGSRQVPGNIQAVNGPGGEFEVTADQQPDTVILNEEGDPIPQFVVDPVNYRRYTPYVEMFEALEPSQVAGLYRSNYPLFQQAFVQLGYPEGEFDDRLLAMVDELLATPAVKEPVRLIKPEAYYLFADEELEALPAGQKMMIRMGNENSARVKSKLSEIREALQSEAVPSKQE